MIIRPFLPDPDSFLSRSKPTQYSSSKTDVSYIQNSSPLRPGYVVVSKKILTDIGEVKVFVKVIFVYEIVYTFDNGPFTEDITCKEDLEKVNYTLKLKTVTSGAFAPGYCFGNMIYKIDDNDITSHVEYKVPHYDSVQNKFNKIESIAKSVDNANVIYVLKEFPLKIEVKTIRESEYVYRKPNFEIVTSLKEVLSNCGKFNFSSYNNDTFEDTNTFSESNLLQLSYDRYMLDRNPIKECDITSVSMIQDMLSDYLAAMVKPYLISNVDDLTFIIDTSIQRNHNPAFTIKNHKNPFGKVIIPQFIETMCESFYKEAVKATLPLCDCFGDVRIICHICDGFFSAHLRFLEDDPPIFVDIPIEEIKVMQTLNQVVNRHFMIISYGNEYLNRYMKMNFENIGNLLNYYA